MQSSYGSESGFGTQIDSKTTSENDAFGDTIDDSEDGEIADANYIPPEKKYVDVLKQYFGHAKFRP